MKNNKGVTLIELIVAFAIVSVATIYFFQTVSLVKRMYANAREETNNYADRTYTIRMLDNFLENYKLGKNLNFENICSDLKLNCNTILWKPKSDGNIYSYDIVDKNNNVYSFYKYLNYKNEASMEGFGSLLGKQDVTTNEIKDAGTYNTYGYSFLIDNMSFRPYFPGWQAGAGNFNNDGSNLNITYNVFSAPNSTQGSNITLNYKLPSNIKKITFTTQLASNCGGKFRNKTTISVGDKSISFEKAALSGKEFGELQTKNIDCSDRTCSGKKININLNTDYNNGCSIYTRIASIEYEYF